MRLSLSLAEDLAVTSKNGLTEDVLRRICIENGMDLVSARSMFPDGAVIKCMFLKDIPKTMVNSFSLADKIKLRGFIDVYATEGHNCVRFEAYAADISAKNGIVCRTENVVCRGDTVKQLRDAIKYCRREIEIRRAPALRAFISNEENNIRKWKILTEKSKSKISTAKKLL